MSGTEIKEYIIGIEQKFPVNQWRIEGVDIWPHIRIKLYIFLLNLDADKPKLNDSYSSQKGKYGIVKRLLKIPGAIMNALSGLYQFYKKLEPKKIIFFGSHFHRTRQNGVYFNRFFDPMVDTHNLQDEVYMIEFERIYEKNYNQKAILPLHQYLNQFKLLKKLNGLFSQSIKENIQLKDYKAFYEELIRDFPAAKNLNISIEALTLWARKVSRTKGFFSKLFKKTKPEKIIFLSYYGYDDLAAAILAAHELGIKTIDFQHGPQTNVHMAYTAWTKHPDRPYNIMPMEYWTWDQRSKDNIEEWAKNLLEIKSQIVGNPFVNYLMLEEAYTSNRNNILFSLQPMEVEKMFPPNLINFINTEQFYWILQLHPRSSVNQQDIKAFFQANNINERKYTVQNSSETPLPNALSKVGCHITHFSGSILEAVEIGIPTVLIHPLAWEIFSDYIDNERVIFINAGDEDFETKFKEFLFKEPNFLNRKDKVSKVYNPLT
ncbi:hypothetical protein [uncultured Salegentibacter sp.]|uniref:hypothetical protein n=1 Tax=uncultured Salegentibacter sp. TaxID=259320 RepID=UPI002593C223|nr:hypothetical protein [uncultured Salegentibacter sp.]